jgi:hypothetical protein
MRARALLVVLAACKAAHPSSSGSEVHIDRRVELVSIVFRLAHTAAYRNTASAYARDIDRELAPFLQHPTVLQASVLAYHGIGYDAPMQLAIHLDDPDPTAEMRALDARWNDVDIPAFIKQLRDFERDAKLDDFFARHAEFYKAVEDRVRSAVDAENPSAWFIDFFGAPGAKFVVVPGLLTSPMSYGVHTSTTMYQILALDQLDAQDLPILGEKDMETLVHEMAHSFVNPLVAGHTGPPVTEAMKKQAYITPQIVMNEACVRAVTVLYVRQRKTAEAAERAIQDEMAREFLYTRALADLWSTYPADRAHFLTKLDAFWKSL